MHVKNASTFTFLFILNDRDELCLRDYDIQLQSFFTFDEKFKEDT